MGTFETVRDRYASSVETLLQGFLKEASRHTGEAISSMTAYQFETGGKRLRAVIPSYIFECLGRDGAVVVPFGAAVEMIHNATLVHDDLQDGDEMRRGHPTVWKKYSSAQAINCGDAMFQYAFQLIRRLELPPTAVLNLMDRATAATLKVIEGQAQEFIMKDESRPGLGRYLEVIRGKTSGLFALPIAGALEAAGCDGAQVDCVERAAQDLGVLFQIQDDYLDLYGEKGRDHRATDIAEGKVSYFVAHVYERGTPAQRDALSRIIKKPREQTSEADIDRALAIIEEVGAKDAARAYMGRILEGAKADRDLGALPAVHGALVALCDRFLKPISSL